MGKKRRRSTRCKGLYALPKPGVQHLLWPSCCPDVLTFHYFCGLMHGLNVPSVLFQTEDVSGYFNQTTKNDFSNGIPLVKGNDASGRLGLAFMYQITDLHGVLYRGIASAFQNHVNSNLVLMAKGLGENMDSVEDVLWQCLQMSSSKANAASLHTVMVLCCHHTIQTLSGARMELLFW